MPYERLAELAEAQLVAVSEGRWEALDELQVEQAELAATLPAVPPQYAKQALQRAAELNDRARTLVEGTKGALLAEGAKLRQGQTALSAYAQAARTAA